MSGILNPQTTILDTIITEQGRNKLTLGDLGIKFVSFQDLTFYAASVQSGSEDATNRPFLECCPLSSDQIAFSSDDSGRLNPFKNTSGIGVSAGKVLASTKKSSLSFVTGSISGSQFIASGSILLDSSIDNFKKMMSIASIAQFEDAEKFTLSHDKISFSITQDNPIAKNGIKTISVENSESLFHDKRLSHVKNFKYLPPINKSNNPEVDQKIPLGFFPPLGKLNNLSPENIEKEIDIAAKKGQTVDIEFSNTSRTNNLFCQFFELKTTDMIKLDVIDYGSYPSFTTEGSTKRIFFAGRLFVDNFGSHTFIHIFTLVFFDK